MAYTSQTVSLGCALLQAYNVERSACQPCLAILPAAESLLHPLHDLNIYSTDPCQTTQTNLAYQNDISFMATGCHAAMGSLEFSHFKVLQPEVTKNSTKTKVFLSRVNKVLHNFRCTSRTRATIATSQSYSESRYLLN